MDPSSQKKNTGGWTVSRSCIMHSGTVGLKSKIVRSPRTTWEIALKFQQKCQIGVKILGLCNQISGWRGPLPRRGTVKRSTVSWFWILALHSVPCPFYIRGDSTAIDKIWRHSTIWVLSQKPGYGSKEVLLIMWDSQKMNFGREIPSISMSQINMNKS